MNIIRKLADRSYRKDLTEFTEMLSILNEEKVAIFLIYSVWLRSILQNEGHINSLKRIDSSNIDIDLEPELHAYPIMLNDFTKTIKFLFKQRQSLKASVLSLWVHTLRSIIRPELNAEIMELWKIILKNIIYWNEKLENIYREVIELGIKRESVENTLKLSKDILKCLPPKQICKYKKPFLRGTTLISNMALNRPH